MHPRTTPGNHEAAPTHFIEGKQRMTLIEHTSSERMTREAAAQRLRDLADELARHNEVTFIRDGRQVTVAVPDEVEVSLEVEIGEENEIEVEITW